MSNSTSVTGTIDFVFAYLSLLLIILGTIMNLMTFFVLFRPVFQNTKKNPTVHYMRAIAIFDIFMLYGWNFDHYLFTVYSYKLQYHSIGLCKLLSFSNYFAAETSAWLRVLVCIERYISLTRLNKTCFSKERTSLIFIIVTVSLIAIIHLHLLIFACYRGLDGQIKSEAKLYKVYPTMDYINLVLYNALPFIIMIIFNSGVIYHLKSLRKTTTVKNSKIRHRSIYTTLLVTTFLFLVMTTPATILFGFFSDKVHSIVLHACDIMMYTYHVMSFPIYLVTFTDFRMEFLKLISCHCKKIEEQSQELGTVVTNPQIQMKTS